jgi:hypothetical protein
MKCPKNSKVWFGSSLTINFSNIDGMHFLDWLYHIIPKIKEEELIQIGALRYGIWDVRIQFIF